MNKQDYVFCRSRSRATARGSVMVYGLIIMTMVAIILTSILGFVSGQIKYALQVHSREEALQAAESGVHFYRWYLAHQVEGRTTQQIKDFWDSGTAYGVGEPYEAEYVDPSGSAIGRYRLEVTPPEDGSTIVIVRSTGWTYQYPDQTRILEVRFRKPSWSEHIVLSNDVLRFGEGTEVFGRVHSNYGIRFDGVAHNQVTSGVPSYNDPDHGGGDEFGVHTHVAPVDPAPPAAVPARPDVFLGGRSFPVETKDFNGVLGDLSFIKSQAQAGTNGSRYFNNQNQGRHIVLRNNGTFDIRTVRSFRSSTNEIINYNGGWQNFALPQDGVIFVENNVWLEGAVNNRRVTIVAANLQSSAQKNVYIGRDIRTTNKECTDIIGIIAQDDIEIYQDSEDDLAIDAAMIAQTGRVGRSHYGGSDYKDAITVYGAIASNERYGFAWTDGTGYANRYLYFDNNLLYCPPPYFPTGTQYEMDLWEEKK